MPPSLLARLQFAALAGLVLFAPDDGGAAGGDAGGTGSTGAGGASTGTDGGTPPPAPTDPADADAAKVTGKTFTQEQVAEMVAKERAKAAKTAEVAKAAERAKMDEVERLKAENADKDKATADRESKATARNVDADLKVEALAAGVSPERAATFLRLVDRTDITVNDDLIADTKAVKKAIADALKDAPEFKAAADAKPAGTSGGNMNGKPAEGKPKTLADAIADHYSS